MAAQSISFDDLLQQNRQKRKAEQLAQEILGKNRRPRPPTAGKQGLGGSLASRMGVNKRTSSLPRSLTVPPHNDRRTSPAQQIRPTLIEKNRARSALNTILDTKSLAGTFRTIASSDVELNIKGAAGGPYVVVAQNFAPGTTAADIESVMVDVGGHLTDCRLVATAPTVIAEMTFVEKAGADAVIAMFNNKKADGRTLHVYMKGPGPALPKATPQAEQPVAIAPQEATRTEDTMEIDLNAEAREAENRLREERRGRLGHSAANGAPDGPRFGQAYNEQPFYRPGRRAVSPTHQQGRYGYGQDHRYDGRGRYADDGRLHTGEIRRGGQGWRR